MFFNLSFFPLLSCTGDRFRCMSSLCYNKVELFMNLQTKGKRMRMGIIVALLFSSVLIPVIVNEAYAKCMVGDDECYGIPIVPPLKFQFQYFALPDIICPNQDHVLAERPNGKLACVTDRLAEKTGWYIHYRNVVDFKGQVHVVSPGTVSWIPFEITGATLDRMIYEDQMLVASVTPNDQHGVLSIELPSGALPAHFEYCNPYNKNPFDTPFVIIIDEQKYPLVEGINSRDQTAVNISLDENSETIEIVRTCYDSKKSSTDSDSKKMKDVQDLENMRKSILELEFDDDVITVLISDETYFGAMTSFEFTTIPVSSLVHAHDMLPETSMNDRMIAGSILSEIVKSGTYVTQNDDREFWYTIGGIESQVITIELQDHEFDRITFVSDKNHEWIGQINNLVD